MRFSTGMWAQMARLMMLGIRIRTGLILTTTLDRATVALPRISVLTRVTTGNTKRRDDLATWFRASSHRRIFNAPRCFVANSSAQLTALPLTRRDPYFLAIQNRVPLSCGAG